MTKTQTNLDIRVNKKQYDFLRTNRKRKAHLFGSAGSGKSWSLAQFLIIEKMFGEHDIRIITTRKTGPALFKSVWLLVQDLLKMYDLPYDINKSERAIYIGSNEMYFTALDDPLKLKSFEKINYVWAEEASEITRHDYMQLGLRCRGANPNGPNAMYFSYNPASGPHNRYLQKITTNPPDDVAILHTTYHDNIFLDDDYIHEIEGLKEIDKVYWTIYGLGRWASPKNTIYTNWDVISTDQWDKAVKLIGDVGYGLDFGYNMPTALTEIAVKEFDLYEKELLYERKLTNTQLIDRLNLLISNKSSPILADCSEPDRIEEISKAGFNIFPCIKGEGSVKIGIDRVKRFKCHIRSNSTNLIEEKQIYKWQEDINGDPIDKPVKYKDHLMDAERYYVGSVEFDLSPAMVYVGNIFD